MVTLTLNSDKLTVQLNALRDVLHSDGVDMLRDEVKSLSKTCVNFIPPFSSGGKSAGAKQAGEGAISRELKNLISEGSPRFLTEVSQKWGVQDVNGWVERKGGEKIAIKFSHVDSTGDRIVEYHEQYRDRRGKVPLLKEQLNTWSARILVAKGTRQTYIEKIQARVGRWKASWAYAAHKLGAVGVPQFISRHFGSISGLAIFDDSGLSNKAAPFIIFGSRAPGNYRMRSGIATAATVRVKAIANRIRLMASGYSHDIAQGIRPKKRAAETKSTEVQL